MGRAFFDQIVSGAGLLKTEVEETLGEMVVHGLVVSDGYSGIRALLTPKKNIRSFAGLEHAGRWTLIARKKKRPPSLNMNFWSRSPLFTCAAGV